MSSCEGHGCSDLCWSSDHIIKAWENGRGSFSSNCAMVEEQVYMKLILIDFCISVVLLGSLYHWRVHGAGRALHSLFLAALQNNTFRMLFFCVLKVLCSMVVYLLDCKKCSLRPLGYLSTKSVFIRAENRLSCKSLSAFLSPQSRKGTSVLPWMGDSLACCCLQFFPPIWLFWCQEIRNPHTLVYAKQTWVESQRMRF